MKKMTRAEAIEQTYKHEKGYVVDHAGPTNDGITIGGARDLGDTNGDGHLEMDLDFDGDIDAKDILLITKEDALRFYNELWKKHDFDRFKGCAPQLFDLSVNMGWTGAMKVFQQAISIVWKPLVIDGKPGKVTMGAFNDACLRSMELPIFQIIQSEARTRYSRIAKNLVASGKVEQPTAERYLYVWNRRLDSWA